MRADDSTTPGRPTPPAPGWMPATAVLTALVTAASLAVAMAPSGVAARTAGDVAVELPPIPEVALPETIEAVTLPPVTTFTLANGLQVVVVERRDRPLAYVLLSVPAGTAQDDPALPGVAEMTAAMLTKGTDTRSAVDIARTIESVGGELAASVAVEEARISAAVLAEHVPLAIELVAEVAQRPAFPASELAILMQQAVAGVQQQFDDPGALAALHADQRLYGDRHPLGHFQTVEELRALTPQHLAVFHRRHYTPQGSRLLVAGDVDPGQVRALVERHFGAWQAAEEARLELPGAVRLEQSRVRFVEWPGQTQVRIELRQPGPPATVDDWLAVSVYNYVLGGGGFASRLMEVVRSRLGQTYDVHTTYAAQAFPAHFSLSTFTRAEEVWSTLEVLRSELRRFYEEGITAEELAKAQRFFILGYPMALETLADVSGSIDRALGSGRGLDWVSEYPVRVAALTVDDVNQAIRRHFDPERFAVVLLGDPRVLEGAPETIWGVPRSQLQRVGRTEVPKPSS
ncbi:MAG: insulinase family protein [Firmicutes bacterium]|nr:insulinase family protein [Bacillota bacterium]